MAEIDLEKLKIKWKGTYSATTTYNEGEVVFYNGASFAAKTENTGVEPIEGRNWELLAISPVPLREKGDMLFYSGTEAVRLPIGAEEMLLRFKSGQIEWTSDEPVGIPGALPVNLSNLSNLGYRLATMSSNASDTYRTYLMADGLIKAVGFGGTDFRNGDPNGSNVYIPSRVNAENNEIRFKEVFSGTSSNYAIDTEDNVWSWGYNNNGQLGHGNTTNIATAKRIEYFVNNNIKIKSVACGNYTYSIAEYSAFFLTTTGRVYACGYNGQGQLGNGSTTQRTTPVRVGSLENITYIYASAAYHAVYAIDSNKELWVWGANAQGQLGLGNSTDQRSPVKVTTFSDVKKVVGGNGFDGLVTNSGFGIAIQEDGTLWSTGYNREGSLGLGNMSNSITWEQSTVNTKFKDITCGQSMYPSCAAISTGGQLYVWGDNNRGQLGDGTTTDKNIPTLVDRTFATNVKKILFGGYSYSTWNQSYGYTYYYQDSFYFQSNNQIYAAGYSSNGNLGTGSTSTTNSTFTPVVGLSGTIKDWTVYGIANTYGLSVLMEDGSIYAGGYNSYGQTGTHKTSTSTVTTLKKVIF